MRTVIVFYLCLFTSLAQANEQGSEYVSIDYPNTTIFFEDKNFPGQPSKRISQYRDELKTWGEKFNINLSNETITNYISQPLYIGYESWDDRYSVNFSISNYQISDQMRDIIFLETLKNSIEHWENNYISLIHDDINLTESYERAMKIFFEYQYYIEKGDFGGNKNNPILTAIFGAGNTSYGNLFTASGLLESYTETTVINLINNFASDKSTVLISDFKPDKQTLAQLGYGFSIDVLKDSGVISSDTKFTLNIIGNTGFSIASGGLGLVLAPGSLLYKTAEYIHIKTNTISQGLHLLIYYNLMNKYQDRADRFLNNNGIYEGAEDMSRAVDHEICVNYNVYRDNVSQSFCNRNGWTFGYLNVDNAAGEDEIRTAYMIANLFLLVKGLDFDALKKEVVARVKLEELKNLEEEADTSWSTGAYADNEDRSKTLSIVGANSLTVTVSGMTEENYDYIYIYDSNGTQIKKLDGNINESFTVTGSSIRVRLTSDSSVTKSGVTISINSGGDIEEGSTTTWTTGAYANNEDRSKTLSIAGVGSLTVTVSGETEAGYDYIYIYDSNGTQVKKLDGNINESFAVTGSSIRAQLISDSSVTKSGATVSISSSSVIEQNIIINNSKLKACLREQFGHEPSQQELQNITRLNCANKGLTDDDTHELQQLSTLTRLYIHENNISDLSFLGNLTSLTSLSFSENPVANLNSLSNLSQLTNLFFGGNQVTDLTPLSNLTQLTNLHFWNTQVTDLSPLRNLTRLRRLGFEQTHLHLGNYGPGLVSDLSPLRNLTQLEAIYFDGNQVNDLSPLRNLSQLTSLDFQNNGVSDLSSLRNLIQLTTLMFSDNQVSDLSPLKNLIQLTNLCFRRNQVTDRSVLTGLTQLGSFGDGECYFENQPL